MNGQDIHQQLIAEADALVEHLKWQDGLTEPQTKNLIKRLRLIAVLALPLK